jgi:hypothetical protein
MRFEMAAELRLGSGPRSVRAKLQHARHWV